LSLTVCPNSSTTFNLNSEVEVGFMEIPWPILGSGCGLRMELRRSWGAVS
jgi:hypothetical protein